MRYRFTGNRVIIVAREGKGNPGVSTEKYPRKVLRMMSNQKRNER